MSILSDNKLPITKEAIIDLLKKSLEHIKNIMIESPDKNLLCRNCSEIINNYNVDFDRKPSSKIKCPKCKALNEMSKCSEESDWDFSITNVSLYLDEMVKIGLLSSSVLGSCAYCISST